MQIVLESLPFSESLKENKGNDSKKHGEIRKVILGYEERRRSSVGFMTSSMSAIALKIVMVFVKPDLMWVDVSATLPISWATKIPSCKSKIPFPLISSNTYPSITAILIATTSTIQRMFLAACIDITPKSNSLHYRNQEASYMPPAEWTNLIDFTFPSDLTPEQHSKLS